MRSQRRIPGAVVPGAAVVIARSATVELGGRAVLRDVDLELRAGELVALVGPNAAGKSTLLGALAGDLPITAGAVSLGGHALAAWTPVELAMRRAVMPQHVDVSFAFPVAEVVRMGRWPWIGTEREDDDEAMVAAAMQAADVAGLAARPVSMLSGGERARVAFARVLAQRAPVMLLDEPTAALDIHHQELLLGAARARAEAGDLVVVVLHDLTLAAAWADRIVVVGGGALVADGRPTEVLTDGLLSRVYGHEIDVIAHPRSGLQIVGARRSCTDREDRDKVS